MYAFIFYMRLIFQFYWCLSGPSLCTVQRYAGLSTHVLQDMVSAYALLRGQECYAALSTSVL